MSTYQVIKTMPRSLTDEEAQNLVEWWEEHSDKNIDEVIAHWEKELGIPITKHAVTKAMMASMPDETP